MSSRYLAHFLEDVGETPKAGSDTGAGVDDASLVADLAASDTGSGVDDASVEADTTDFADSDSGSGIDAASLEAAQPASETGTGVDSATLEAARQTGDSGVGVDAAFIDSPTPSEAGSGSDDARVVKLGTESLAAAEALCGPYAGPVDIRYDGIEITSCVIFEQTGFRSIANGIAGTCLIRVRDLAQQYNFVVGRSLSLTINGQREWTGFVTKVRRGYFFNGTPDSPGDTVRYFDLEGVDLNVLFQKRFLYDKASPTTVQLTTYQPDTPDDEIIVQYVADHLDLGGDGISTAGVEHVGTPSEDDEISGAAGWSWGEFMRFLRFNTGAVDYIDPDGVLQHVDVDSANAPFAVSDTPSGAEEGYRELEIDFDGTQLRNDVMVWGAGQGAQQVRFARVTDAASVAEHGTWQIGQFMPTIFRQVTVDHIADSYVYGSPQSQRGGKDDATAVRFVTHRQGLRVAQKISVTTDTFGFSDVLPIRSVEIAFATPTDPLWRVAASHALDDPWSTSEFWFPQFNFPSLGIPGLDIPPFGLPNFDLPPFDPCVDANCIDTFTRSEDDSWGISEFSPDVEWQQDIAVGNADVGQINVDGSAGTVNPLAGNGSADGFSFWVEPGLDLEFPTEILANFEWRWNELEENWNGIFGFDGSPDPMGSTDWIYGTYQRDRNASPPYDWTIEYQVETSLGSTALTKSFIVGSTPDSATYIIADMWVRLRVESSIAKVKMWKEGTSEPSDWSETTGSFSGLVLKFLSVLLTTASDGIDASSFKIKSYEIIEGCGTLPCFSPTPPPADPPRSTAACEVLEAISAPPVQPAGYNYYQFSAGYLNGTTRIFKDGIFLRRGIDYLEILPSLGVIAIDDSLIVLFAVYGCYEAQP